MMISEVEGLEEFNKRTSAFDVCLNSFLITKLFSDMVNVLWIDERSDK